jgi:RES domain-containing protein
MLSGEALKQALSEVTLTPWTGVAYRLIPAQFAGTALSSIGSYRRGGRYNPKEGFEALYLADTPLTALQEINLMRITDGAILSAKSAPRLLLSVEVVLSAVLDVTTGENQDVLGTNVQELTGNWLVLNATGQTAPTQDLGSAAYSLATIEALRVASAQDPRASNLVVLPDRLAQRSSVRVYDDSGLIDATLPALS